MLESTARVFLFIPPHVFYLIFLFCPRMVVRVGFLIWLGWRAVGPILEGLGLMTFSLAPFGLL